VDYIVCDSDSLESLQRRVNEYLKLNYTVIGGIAIARERISGPLRYCQAIIKIGTEPQTHGWQLSQNSMIKRKPGRPKKTSFGQSVA
jgi:hypothetical protein